MTAYYTKSSDGYLAIDFMDSFVWRKNAPPYLFQTYKEAFEAGIYANDSFKVAEKELKAYTICSVEIDI